MPTDGTESESKLNLNIDLYRKHVQNYINMHIYGAALYWAEKVVALTCNNPRDVYWLAQCMYLKQQYHRAAHLLRSRNLDKTYVLCNYLTVKCLLKAKELNEAFKVLNSMDAEVFLQASSADLMSLRPEFTSFDDTPKQQICSSVFLIKAKVLEAMENRGLAADCYRQALQCDVYCFEAFTALIQYHMLTAEEEIELLNSLPISQQCSPEEAEVLLMLYRSELKKYHGVPIPTAGPKGGSEALFSSSTPRPNVLAQSTPGVGAAPTPDFPVETNPVFARLQQSLDVMVSEAEYSYYMCDYWQCGKLTENILKIDPCHNKCLPIHISCLVELKQNIKLFTLAHKLVDLYPNLAISWYAVGCYYFVIGKSDCSRQHLLKATTLDKLFGPAWLAYGHSFAIDNEHDQAMAAYFKASQLMKGCHLPLLYIGMECGLTNNVLLATNFFEQAIKIAPNDPFVLQEMGVIAFQRLKYDEAEAHFKDALKSVQASGTQKVLPECWASLFNNLGHALRKQQKYEEALEYHYKSLELRPQAPETYSAIAFNYSLMGNLAEAIDWFHKALGLKGDDTFSMTMLNYVLEHWSEEVSPFPGAPDEVPDYQSVSDSKLKPKLKTVGLPKFDSPSLFSYLDESLSVDESAKNESDMSIC